MNIFRKALTFGSSMPIKNFDTTHSATVIESCIISCVDRTGHPASGFRCIAGRSGAFLALLFVAQAWVPGAVAQLPAPPQHATIVVFTDRPMSSEQWPELFSALRTGLANGGVETRELDRNADFIRGEDLSPGLEVESAVSVFLHGNCSLEPLERRTAFAVPLGWVHRTDGQIQPFVHVDCTRIGQVIGAQTRWLSRQGRDKVMAGALARVILHEWIHIATQNPGHAESGIARAQFGVADLMGDTRACSAPRAGQ
jgi:hypothetical protein